MHKNVSVNKAMWKGRLMVTILPVLICLGFVVISVVIADDMPDKWIIGITILACLLLLSTYRAAMTAKWYIWALNNVRNVHELRQRAIFERLMPNKKNQFVKVSGKHHKIITELEKKFEVSDEFADDPKIPAETTIYIAKAQKIFMLAIMLVCFIAGISLVFIAHLYLVGCMMCLVSGCLAYIYGKSISNNPPQIIINNSGIETVTAGFHGWDEIRNEIVGIEGDTDYKGLVNYDSRRSTYYYLGFDYDGGKENFPIYDLNTNHWKLAKLLRVYRSRSIL